MKPKPTRERIAIVVEFLPDPAEKTHGSHYARSNAYRLKMVLKLMLRSFGMRCLKIRNEATESAGSASETRSTEQADESAVEQQRAAEAALAPLESVRRTD